LGQANCPKYFGLKFWSKCILESKNVKAVIGRIFSSPGVEAPPEDPDHAPRPELNQSIGQSVSQSVSQSINQSINQSIG
jgi:hypothetical protein